MKVLHRLGLIILLDSYYGEYHFQGFTPYDFELRKGSQVEIKDVAIYGTRYITQDDPLLITQIARNLPDFHDTGKYHILLQHFEIAGQMKNVPGIPLSALNLLKKKTLDVPKQFPPLKQLSPAVFFLLRDIKSYYQALMEKEYFFSIKLNKLH
ncbi:MAG: hypothetical protein ACTSWC_03045 [Promethearchaeota archaeon]